MVTRAELPDGRVLEFPDETPETIIDGAVRDQLGVEPKPGPRNPAAMTEAEKAFPEADIGEYRPPYQAPSEQVEEGDYATLSDVPGKIIENLPQRFKRVFAGATQAAGERGAEAYARPETAAPAAAGLTGADLAALEPEVSRETREAAARGAEEEGLAAVGRKWFEEANEKLRENYPNLEPQSPAYYAYHAGSAMLEMGPALAATLVTKRPNVGIAMMGGQVGADRYAEARERGLEPSQAAGEAMYYAATEALTEKIPLGVLARGGRNALSRTLKAGVAEGLQEPLSEALQMGYESGFLDEDLSLKEATRRLYDAGVIGFLAGGGLSISTEPFVRAQRRTEQRDEPAAESAPGEEVARETPAETEETAPEQEATQAAQEPSVDEGVATQAQRAAAGELPLDEVVPERRVAEMGREEMERSLLESDVAGLPNRRAFLEAEKKPGRAAADVDSLKWINDNASHDAGNALLGAAGRAFRNSGVEAYHISGDEFVAQANSPEEAQAAMERVEQELQQATVRATMPDGTQIEVTPGISYGTGTTLAEAERGLGRAKAEREAGGQRAARGQRPPAVRDVEGQGGRAGVQPRGREDRGAAARGVEAMGVEALPGEQYQPMLREAAPPETPVIDLSGGRQVEVPAEPIRRRDIVRDIERAFGNRIYTGRVKGKLLGFHRKSNNEIRTKRVDDLEVVAHELAHWLDDRYPAFRQSYQPHADELKGISYDASSTTEGFAEFVRLWMTQEREARERAPGYFETFETTLGETGLDATLRPLQERMHAWYYQGAKQRLASKIGAPRSMRQRLDAATDRATDRFITQALDGLHEIAVAEKDLTGYIADATQSPYKAFRLVAGARGTVKSVFHYGTIGWKNGDIAFTGPSLESVFAPISDNLDNAKLYFAARRARELKEQGRERLIEEDEIDAGLREGERDPRLKTAFDEWIAFNKRMMDFYEDSGIVSTESRAKMEEANRDYVPFHRIIETVSGQEGVRTGAFQRLRGGTQNLGDIFENMEQSVATLTRMSLINRAKQLAYDMVDQSRGGSYYAVKIPTEVKPVQVIESDLIAKVLPGFGLTPAQFRAYRDNGQVPDGFTPRDMEAVELVLDRMKAMDQFTTFFQHGQAPQGDAIDTVMRDGKTEYYEVGDPLWLISMSHFGPKNINLALKIAGGFSNTLRRTVTSMPSFLIPNLARDGTNAIMFSRGGFKGRIPFAGAVHGWSDAVTRDDTYWRFMANGGGFSSTIHGEVEQSVERFYAREGINYNTVLDTPRKLLDNWDTITSAFEYGTRLGEFRQVEQRGGGTREAALAGREISTDFSMHGASQTLAAIRLSVPFFNTRVQGLYKIFREAGATKEGTQSKPRMAAVFAMRGLSLLTIPSLALWAWNNLDEDRERKYQSLPNWVRDMHWVIYVPGRDAPFLIPKPFEIGAMFATVPERMADAAVNGDGEELGPALKWILAEQLNLHPMPQVFNPVYEDMTNENFLDMPVIPPDLQDVDPVEQYRPWTPETAIAIGRKLGVSPMKVEHYLRGYFGTLAGELLAASDFMLHDVERYGEKPARELTDYPVVRRFTGKQVPSSTKEQREWYEFMRSVREAQQTVGKIVDEGRDPSEYLASRPETETLYGVSQAASYSDITDAINELQAAMDQVRASKTMTGEAKREKMQDLQRQLNEVYRRGSELAENIEESPDGR